MPEARGASGDTKVACNEGGEAPESPECLAQAMRPHALAPERAELEALCRTQVRLTTTGMGCGIEASRSVWGTGITPAAHRAGGGGDGAGHWPDAPASLKRRDGDSASAFELARGAFRSPGVPIGSINRSL